MKLMKEKIKAVMIGHAVGDALGVPVEFCSREELTQAPVTTMTGYGRYPVPAGAWSDDTSMALAALDILSCGKINEFEIMVNFAMWLDEGRFTPTGECFDVGRTCMNAIHAFVVRCRESQEDFDLQPDFDATECGARGENDNGNGSLMRIHPFSLMIWYKKEMRQDLETIIDRASALTHAHERSKLACKIYTMILHELLDHPTKESIAFALEKAKETYKSNPEFHHYARLFEKHFAKLATHKIKSSGYVVDTLEAAVWCLLTTNSYKECVLKAVNLGEDTDTVGAIAGGLAGALYGYDAIPSEWKETLIKRNEIETLCQRACENWLT